MNGETTTTSEFIKMGGKIFRINEKPEARVKRTMVKVLDDNGNVIIGEDGQPKREHKELVLVEYERIITVAYYRRNGKIHYGAVIFRKDKPVESWCRKRHNQTAVGRAAKYPVVIEQIAGETERQLRGRIRQAIGSIGCDHGRPRNSSTRIMRNAIQEVHARSST